MFNPGYAPVSEREHDSRILGEKLVMVPVTYMEGSNEAIRGESKYETLAAEAEINVSRGLTRDMKKTQDTETRKWKKIERAVKPKTPTQGCSSKERDEGVRKKRRGRAEQKDGNTSGRKKNKGSTQ